MKAALALVLIAGAIGGFAARPAIDDAAFAVSENCDRATLPDASGRYRAVGATCQIADWIAYGVDFAPNPRATACWIADMRPTDANIEACTGQPISLAAEPDPRN